MITASSTGYVLPPFLISKASKSRNKSYKDLPAKEEVTFRDGETKRLVERSQLVACQTFSGWNNQRVMKKFYLLFYFRNTSKDFFSHIHVLLCSSDRHCIRVKLHYCRRWIRSVTVTFSPIGGSPSGEHRIRCCGSTPLHFPQIPF